MRRTVLENLLRGLLLGVLILLPLPYGLVESHWNDRAALVLLGIAICSILLVVSERRQMLAPRRLAASSAAIASLLVIAALQLVPFGEGLVGTISPESLEIWQRGSALSMALGGPVLTPHMTIDVEMTLAMLVRLVALLAMLTASALLFRRRAHRRWFAIAIAASALVQFGFAFRQWLDPDPVSTIWGWRNLTIVNRVSGTFVNPNHFAHYLALSVPLLLYLAAAVVARSREAERGARLQRFLERQLLPFSILLVVILVIVGGMFLAQSRGAVAALFASLFLAYVFAGRGAQNRKSARERNRQILLLGSAVVVSLGVVAVIVMRFGEQDTIRRMVSLQDQSVSIRGRIEGIDASFDVWRKFPVFGSGLGTFERLSWTEDRGGLLRHAHNDYLEILATGGAVSLAVLVIGVAIVLLDFRGELRSSRDALEKRRNGGDRRRFGLAALAALLFAMIHSIYDFNLFIPANPLTLVAIIGVASAAHPRSTKIAETNSNEE